MAGAGDRLWGFSAVGPPPNPAPVTEVLARTAEEFAKREEARRQFERQMALRELQERDMARIREEQVAAMREYREGLIEDRRQKALERMRAGEVAPINATAGEANKLADTQNPLLQEAMAVPNKATGISPVQSLTQNVGGMRRSAAQAMQYGYVPQQPVQASRFTQEAEDPFGNAARGALASAGLGQAPGPTEVQETYQPPPASPAETAQSYKESMGPIQQEIGQNAATIQAQRAKERAATAHPDRTLEQLYKQELHGHVGAITQLLGKGITRDVLQRILAARTQEDAKIQNETEAEVWRHVDGARFNGQKLGLAQSTVDGMIGGVKAMPQPSGVVPGPTPPQPGTTASTPGGSGTPDIPPMTQ